MNKIDENVSYVEWQKKRYENRKDKDNIFPIGISREEFIDWIIEYLWDKDYIVDPLGPTQCYELILEDILYTHSKRFRKEMKEDNDELKKEIKKCLELTRKQKK